MYYNNVRVTYCYRYKQERGVVCNINVGIDEAVGSLAMWGQIKPLEEIVRLYGGPNMMPPYPGTYAVGYSTMDILCGVCIVGVAELPEPYEDHAIIIDVRCIAALINDPRGTGKNPNMYWKFPDMQVAHVHRRTRFTRFFMC